MIWNSREKNRRRDHNSTIGALGRKHAVISTVIIAIIMLTTMATPCLAAENDIEWTEDELAFMEEHPVIRLGVDPGFVPFEFIDENGEYKGIAADYLALISEKTGLRFEVVKGLTWPEAYDKALAGEIDALPAVGKTSEREAHFLLSEPYYKFKRVIVTGDTETGISGMDDLEGMTVAVQRNSSHHSYLLSYPKINLSLYDSVESALTAVATGEETAFIGNLATTNYLIRSNGLTNLRFVSFEAEKQQSLYFAVRKDWPELVSIFNKAILMDLHMPVMSGYEAAEKIREVSTKVPIVAMTADVILGVRNKCEQSGIFHYISKPFNPDYFIKTIKDIISQSKTDMDTDTTVLDRRLGLKNMNGNIELYNQVLQEYLNENQDTADNCVGKIYQLAREGF